MAVEGFQSGISAFPHPGRHQVMVIYHVVIAIIVPSAVAVVLFNPLRGVITGVTVLLLSPF